MPLILGHTQSMRVVFTEYQIQNPSCEFISRWGRRSSMNWWNLAWFTWKLEMVYLAKRSVMHSTDWHDSSALHSRLKTWMIAVDWNRNSSKQCRPPLDEPLFFLLHVLLHGFPGGGHVNVRIRAFELFVVFVRVILPLMSCPVPVYNNQ